MMERFETNSF